jgi:hypothetical protein
MITIFYSILHTTSTVTIIAKSHNISFVNDMSYINVS